MILGRFKAWLYPTNIFDHFKHANEYLKAGIEVYASESTHSEKESPFKRIMRVGYWYQIGGFNVTPFSLVHDVECFGFVIRHDKIGTMLFITDTEYVKQNFKALKPNHIMIECNYSQKIIDARVESNSIDKGLRDRVLKSHMELETCKGFIQANKTSSLYNVCLLHLSDGNSHELEFKEDIESIVDNTVLVTVASNGLELVLDLTPF